MCKPHHREIENNKKIDHVRWVAVSRHDMYQKHIVISNKYILNFIFYFYCFCSFIPCCRWYIYIFFCSSHLAPFPFIHSLSVGPFFRDFAIYVFMRILALVLLIIWFRMHSSAATTAIAFDKFFLACSSSRLLLFTHLFRASHTM